MRSWIIKESILSSISHWFLKSGRLASPECHGGKPALPLTESVRPIEHLQFQRLTMEG